MTMSNVIKPSKIWPSIVLKIKFTFIFLGIFEFVVAIEHKYAHYTSQP